MQDLSVIPRGYQKGNKYLFGLVYWSAILLELPFFLFGRHRLLGKGNLDLVRKYRAQGCKIAMDCDHYSVMDIPIPLALLWWHGYRDLINNIFFLIGIRWAEKWLLKGANRAYVVPPTELPLADNMTAMRPVAEFNTAAKKAAWKALLDGAMLWLSAHGTRSRKGVIEKAPEGARRFWQEADYVVPVAIEGTRQLMRPGLKWYQVWHLRPGAKVTIMVGRPLPRCEVATVRIVVYERARLHFLKGNPLMAGDYLDDLVSEYGGQKVREVAI